MNKYRLIIASTENGGKEIVTFLNSNDLTSIEDLLRPGYTVDFDGIILAELPDCFPTDYELGRGC